MDYSITTDFIEIIAGTNNRASSKYLEAAKAVDKDTTKSSAYIKNFITSIENVASKSNVKDTRISSSKGNIKNFSGYENIQKIMKFVDKHIGASALSGDLQKICKYLEDNINLYSEGYEKNVRLITLEYENAVYILTAGYSTLMANIELKEQNGKISVSKGSGDTRSVLSKTITEFKTQLYKKDHKDYLNALLEGSKNVKVNTNIEESVSFMEASIADTVELIDSIFISIGRIAGTGKRLVMAVKNSIFGIVPLIRTILYLRYKKKADTVLALDQQVKFIEMNINQLENTKNMDPAKKAEIIKKQKAVVESYKKKATKLRAELSDGEREAVTAIKKEDPEMKNTTDDFILEGGITVMQIFGESAVKFTRREKGHAINAANIGSKTANVNAARKDNFFTNNKTAKKAMNVSANSNKATDNPKLLDESLWKKAYDELVAKTGKDTIRLIPGKGVAKDDDMNKRTATKIGGNPYWPKNKEWPMSSDNKPLICLCQLNLSELPNISELPKSGILQFFVIDGEWDSTGAGPNVKVIHHMDIVNKDEILTEIPRSTCSGKENDYPIEGVYFPTAKLEKMPITIADYKFHKTLVSIFNKIFDVNMEERSAAWNIDEYSTNRKKVDELFWKYFAGKGSDYAGCRVCGHPYFTQYDIREANPSFDTLLLQLDSEAGMMWGDCGVANFFISKSNLSNEKFENNVFYTWDCC